MKVFLKNIDDYIISQPEEVRERLEQIRQAIIKSAPEAEESISYGMPTFKFNGPLVYFAAYKNHIGFYSLPSAHRVFQKELVGYKQGKGSVQFPLDKPLPLTLIKKMIKFRVKENREKQKMKKRAA